MKDYILHFGANQENPESFSIPEGKRLYLTRPPQVAQGTATVQNVATGKTYVIPDGERVIEIEHPPKDVKLAFCARSNDLVTFVMATVKS